MKRLSYPMIAAIAGLLIVSSSAARAADTSACCSGACCNDGIAASPKLRAILDERCLSKCTPAQVTVSTITPQTAFAASPKVQQMNNQNASAAVIQVAPETAGYQATGSDGIAASPKVRAMLNERSQEVQIAPLK